MTTALLERPEPVLVPAEPPRTRHRALLPAVLGIVGGLVSFLGSWIPSYWGDEAASVMSATRPLGSLFSALGNIDAVHGTYYVFLHFWIQVFGASELSVRLPSAVGAGLVVAGTVVLARILFTTRVAVMAGIVCAVLPRLTYMGAEGRSYALASAVGVWLTVALITRLRSRETRRRSWLGYSALLALGLYLFLYLGLIVLVHGAMVLSQRPSAIVARRWVWATALAALVAAPVIVVGALQHGQISFLAHRNYATFPRIAVDQWFGNVGLAIACWSLIAIGIAVAIRRRDAAATPMVLWLFLPMAILFAVDKLIMPTYNERYLSFCVPAAAVLIALGISAIRVRWIGITALLAVIALAVPTYLAQRGPYAKPWGSDLRQAAELLAAHASPGDAVVFDEAVSASRKPRLALHLYPQDFTGLKDVALATPYTDRPGLWDTTLPVSSLGAQLVGTNVVWALELRGTVHPADVRDLTGLGYVVVQKFHSHHTTIYEMKRAAS